MHAEYAVRFLFDQKLDLALGVQVRLGARIRKEREPADPVPHALLLQVLFRLPDPRHLRVCVNHARNRVIIHVAVARVNVLRRRDALLLCLMREHWPEGDVADALDVRYACVELVIDHDTPARINFDANFFEAEAIDIWSATDSDKDNIGLNLWARLNPHTTRMQELLTVSCFPSFAASVVTMTFPSFFSAERTFVFNLNLRPCLVSDFWNCLLSVKYTLRVKGQKIER